LNNIPQDKGKILPGNKSNILVNGKAYSLNQKPHVGNVDLETLLPNDEYSDDDIILNRTKTKDPYVEYSRCESRPEIKEEKIVHFLEGTPKPKIRVRKQKDPVTREHINKQRKTKEYNIHKEPIDIPVNKNKIKEPLHRFKVKRKHKVKDPLESSEEERNRKVKVKDPLKSHNKVSKKKGLKDPLDESSEEMAIKHKIKDPLSMQTNIRKHKIKDPLRQRMCNKINNINIVEQDNLCDAPSEEDEKCNLVDNTNTDSSVEDIDKQSTVYIDLCTGNVMTQGTISVNLNKRENIKESETSEDSASINAVYNTGKNPADNLDIDIESEIGG
jgi:hypothetical protein